MKSISDLKNIVETHKMLDAPIKTMRQGRHVEFVVGIGKDHVAFLTMTHEAYEELLSMEESS